MARISTIGIVTADRPAAVERAVNSLRHERGRRLPRLVVIDGSRMAEHRRRTRAVAKRASAETGRTVDYIGPGEVSRLRQALSLRPDSKQPLASGGAGANRNLLLLLTAGENVLFLDDDIVPEARALPSRRRGLDVVGHEERREFRFFKDRASALRTTRPTSTTLVEAHDDLLGRSLKSLLESESDGRLGDVCEYVRARFEAGRRLRVKLTFAGIVGDAATYDPHRFLLSGEGTLRRHLWSGQTIFESALTSRETVRVAARNYLTHNANCMAGCMGVSNRQVMPPFPWTGGNEDGVFGALVHATEPSALFGHLSVAVLHDSRRPSQYGAAQTPSASESRLSELLINVIRHVSSSLEIEAPDARLKRVGASFVDLASWRLDELRAFVTRLTLAVRFREFERAELESRRPDCPPHWRGALAQYRSRFLSTWSTDRFCLPLEFHRAESTDAGFRQLRAFLRRFGDFLINWPQLWNEARKLNLISNVL